jgi:hypothetical protein
MLLAVDVGLENSIGVGSISNIWSEKSALCSAETCTKGECIEGIDLQQSSP